MFFLIFQENYDQIIWWKLNKKTLLNQTLYSTLMPKNQKLFNINLFLTQLIWKERGTYKTNVRYFSKKGK